MKKFRIGISGGGFIGCLHGKNILDGKVNNAELVGVVARSETSKKNVREKLGEKVKLFANDDEMLTSKEVDGVLIATPHYAHPDQGIAAFKHGKHVLMEKPVGVYTQNVRELNALAVSSGLQFATMFNMRAKPIFRKLKELLSQNQIGVLRRIQWNITDMYRSQAYYNSNAWRATWQGEGGGVLINQGSHYLDLWQWFFGMPVSIHSFCAFGKYRDIEVEDDVTTHFLYASGLTGILHVTTGEVCGSNRLEIIGDAGKIIFEGNDLTLMKTKISGTEFNRTNTNVWSAPDFSKEVFTLADNPNSHADITSNWVKAVNGTESIIAPGVEGINSLLLSNAMVLSGWKNSTIHLPFDENEYYQLLQKNIKNSKKSKT